VLRNALVLPVLSLFSGIGLLDQAFEESGFMVVRGPDLLWGDDIRDFHPQPGHFGGIIGGPPCQAFSRLRYLAEYNGYQLSPNLIGSELRKDPCSRKGENFGPVERGRNQKRLWCNLFPEDRKAWPATFPDGKQAGLGHQRSHWISADLFSRAGFVSTYQTTSIEHGLSKEATHG